MYRSKISFSKWEFLDITAATQAAVSYVQTLFARELLKDNENLKEQINQMDLPGFLKEQSLFNYKKRSVFYKVVARKRIVNIPKTFLYVKYTVQMSGIQLKFGFYSTQLTLSEIKQIVQFIIDIKRHFRTERKKELIRTRLGIVDLIKNTNNVELIQKIFDLRSQELNV
jgi:hypothetical protein